MMDLLDKDFKTTILKMCKEWDGMEKLRLYEKMEIPIKR